MLPDFVSTKLSKYIDLNREGTLIKETVDSSDILTSSNTKLRSVINLEKVNNIRRINKFHEAVNQALTKNGIYVSCTQTLESRRKLIREKTPLGFRNIEGHNLVYYPVHQVLKVSFRVGDKDILSSEYCAKPSALSNES